MKYIDLNENKDAEVTVKGEEEGMEYLRSK